MPANPKHNRLRVLAAELDERQKEIAQLTQEESPGTNTIRDEILATTRTFQAAVARVPRDRPPTGNASKGKGKSTDGGKAAPKDADAERVKKSQTRLAGILKSGLGTPTTPAQFTTRWVERPETRPTTAQEEDVALSHLLRGYYASGGQKEWLRSLETGLTHDDDSSLSARLASYKSAKVDDHVECLLGQHAFLTNEAASHQLNSFTSGILQILAALQFSTMWNSKKKYDKTFFLHQAFVEAETLCEQFNHCSDATGFSELVKGTYQKEYDAWYAKFKRLITARNKLFAVYDLFGLSVMLDPFWSPSNLHEHRRSSHFATVFKLLFESNLPNDPDDEDVLINKSRYKGTTEAQLI
ncbi:hypothetical protein C8R43DRAFT_1142977 [Mycena crocata]|nr:hypothetical protein C8R43DRAFT_1142977 [Mycena crocata]